jgi:hypothetical protein
MEVGYLKIDYGDTYENVRILRKGFARDTAGFQVTSFLRRKKGLIKRIVARQVKEECERHDAARDFLSSL